MDPPNHSIGLPAGDSRVAWTERSAIRALNNVNKPPYSTSLHTGYLWAICSNSASLGKEVYYFPFFVYASLIISRLILGYMAKRVITIVVCISCGLEAILHR